MFLEILKYYFLKLVEPIEKLFQHVGKEECLITEEQVNHLVSISEIGDILLSHENQRLTAELIPGFWDHAALVNDLGKITEAVGSGVREKPFQEWCYKKDYICVIRHKFATKEQKLGAGKFSRTNIGKKYDFQFTKYDWKFVWKNLLKFKNPFVKINNDNIYCSENDLDSWRSQDQLFMNHIPNDKQILPQDFYDFAQKNSYLEIIYDSRKD